jgi:hypothetical protein
MHLVVLKAEQDNFLDSLVVSWALATVFSEHQRPFEQLDSEVLPIECQSGGGPADANTDD